MKKFRAFLFVIVGLSFLYGVSCQSSVKPTKPQNQELLQDIEKFRTNTKEELISKQTENPQTAISDPHGPSPKIEFENTVHDFGSINVSSDSRCEFKFTNNGNRLLKIQKIQSTCGCTIPSLAKKIYKPGESGSIKVTYSAGTTKGSVNKKIYVLSNDTKNPRLALAIKAEIVQRVTAEPETLNLLLNKKNAGCPDIALKSTDDVPFSVKNIKSSFEGIKIDFDPNEIAKTLILKPQVDIDKLEEGSYGKIDIELTHPQCKLISVHFSVLPKFRIEPRYLTLLQAQPGVPVQKQLWILSNYDENFKIVSVEPEEPDKGIIKVLKQEKIGHRYKFNLQITPPANEKNTTMFMDKLIITTKNNEKLEVLCSGFYAFKQDDLKTLPTLPSPDKK